MSLAKRNIRSQFRDRVFKRDNHKCKTCGAPGSLDAHHITDRNLMPNGGYVPENGISLCEPCHEKAEVFHNTGTALPGWSPDDLYKLIDSDRVKAYAASERLRER